MNEQNQVEVSFVVPAYNTEKYIERCLNSIVKQNIDNYEIVVVDDCSEDNTYEILQIISEQNKKVKLYRNKENKGAGYTKNRALSMCGGKYVCFVDSDDWLVEGAIKPVFELAEKEQCDDVYYEMQSVIEGEKIVTIKNKQPHVEKIYDKGLCFFELMLDKQRVTVAAGHHFVRRNVISEKVRFSEGAVNDDWEFSVQLYRNLNKTIVLNNSYYVYFHRKIGSVTNTAHRISRISEIYQQVNALYCDDWGSDKICNRIKNKIFLCRMVELQGEIFSKKPGWRDEIAGVMYMLNANVAQKEMFEKSKSMSAYGIVNQNVLETARQAGEVYIYGAGAYGKDAYRVLKTYGIEVKSFVTTTGEGVDSLEIPLQGIDNFQPIKNSYILVAVSERYKEEVIRIIEKKTSCEYGCLTI